MRRVATIFASLALAVFSGTSARADAIWTGTPSGSPLIRDIKITRIGGDKLYFEVRGNESSRDLTKVTRIAVDSEPALTAGEDAFAVEKMDDAITNYSKVIRGVSGPNGIAANKLWLVDWSSRRLQAAAEKSGRFDAAVIAYVTRLQFDPAASAPKPTLPDSQTTYLDTAVTDTTSALTNPKLTDGQRVALFSFLIDLHRARHDAKAADAVSEQLDEVLAKDPTNPNAFRAIARRKLQNAQAAADRKDWRTAFAEVDSNRALFSDPTQQADALYLLAESRYQIATAAAGGGKISAATAPAYKEAAIAFVRLIANFKDSTDKPHVAQSLYRLAQLEETLGDNSAAINVYGQLIAQFPDDPATGEARRTLARLRSATPTSQPS